MPVAAQRDLDATRAALSSWLGRDVADLSMPPSTGFSHETILFTAGGQGLVARVKPTAHTVFPDDTFDLERRAMEALGPHARVPRITAACDDPAVLGAPFFVMERVDGLIPSDNPPYPMGGWLHDLPAGEQARVWWSGLEAMAEVHRAPVGAVPFLRGPATLERARAYLRWVAGGDPFEPAERVLAWLDANAPAPAEPAVCWGDSRLANMVFRDGRCVAVLDWEMATIGDPREDLAWFCYFDRLFSEGLDTPPLPGIPPRAETVARWESLTGRSAEAYGWFEVLAAFRFACIMLRVGQLLRDTGVLPIDSDFGTNNFATAFMARVHEEHA